MRDFSIFGLISQSAQAFSMTPVRDLQPNIIELRTRLIQANELITSVQSDLIGCEIEVVQMFLPLFKVFSLVVGNPGTLLAELETARKVYDKYIFSLLKGTK